jgi:hypothetical protein
VGIETIFLLPLLLSLFDSSCGSVDSDRGMVARKLAQTHTKTCTSLHLRTIPETDISVDFTNHAVAFYFEVNNTLSHKPKHMCSDITQNSGPPR